MNEPVLYEERLSSNRTEALFLGLTALFGGLYAWRQRAGWQGGWFSLAFGLGALVFGFYSLNYRTLVIRLTSTALTLTFGLFRWVVPLDNIAACQRDEPPPLARFGGAGIHFMLVQKRYRASLNFLEYPRVVLAFRQPVGPVRDLSFSTQQPLRVCQFIQAAVASSARN